MSKLLILATTRILSIIAIFSVPLLPIQVLAAGQAQQQLLPPTFRSPSYAAGTPCPSAQPGSPGSILFYSGDTTNGVVPSGTATTSNSAINCSGYYTPPAGNSPGYWTATPTVIDPSRGWVGIGTSTPYAALDLAGPAGTAWELQDVKAGADTKRWFFQVDGSAVSGAANNFIGYIANDADNTSTQWLNVNRTGMTINSVVIPNGYVGIGTATPQTALDVEGTLHLGTTSVINIGDSCTLAGSLSGDGKSPNGILVCVSLPNGQLQWSPLATRPVVGESLGVNATSTGVWDKTSSTTHDMCVLSYQGNVTDNGNLCANCGVFHNADNTWTLRAQQNCAGQVFCGATCFDFNNSTGISGSNGQCGNAPNTCSSGIVANTTSKSNSTYCQQGAGANAGSYYLYTLIFANNSCPAGFTTYSSKYGYSYCLLITTGTCPSPSPAYIEYNWTCLGSGAGSSAQCYQHN
jgi:hypothetical protein